MTELNVELGSRSYPIFVGGGAFELALAKMAELRSGKKKVFCIADAAVLKAHAEKLAEISKYAELFEIAGGEGSKSFPMLAEICSKLARHNADRKSAVFAFGGGVVGDLAGFVSAVYMRGIEFYQIPTTLLAMVDSSVGGKTGINIPEGKNLVGAFHQPHGVFSDTEFLETLPVREFAAGMAEVVKCAVLGDKRFFEQLEKESKPLGPKHPYLAEAILKSCGLKAKVVAQDEFETSKNGGRALLNLGHTFGHAVENCAGYGNFLHGEAVAIGMAFAARLSKKLGKISDVEVGRIETMLKLCGLPVEVKASVFAENKSAPGNIQREESAEKLMRAMMRDKKTQLGVLRFVGVNAIGETETEEVPQDTVKSMVSEFLK